MGMARWYGTVCEGRLGMGVVWDKAASWYEYRAIVHTHPSQDGPHLHPYVVSTLGPQCILGARRGPGLESDWPDLELLF